MIKMLSAIGRIVIVAGAALVVVVAASGGYFYALSREASTYGDFTISGRGQFTPSEAVCTLLGAGLGIIVAGAVFGTIATLYDIRDSLRLLAGSRSPGPTLTRDARQEPRIV